MLRREVLGLDPIPRSPPHPDWWGKAWEGVPVHVVEDNPDQLVTYIAPGAEIGFVEGTWPTPDGRHPWYGREQWQGHGCLMVQQAGDHHAVWHLWEGPDRAFSCWYINLQTAFARTAHGYDTQDLELDVVVWPDGSWVFKDLDVLDERVEEGRFTDQLVTWIRGLGERLGEDLSAGRWWWDPAWSQWEPDPSWTSPDLMTDWQVQS